MANFKFLLIVLIALVISGCDGGGGGGGDGGPQVDVDLKGRVENETIETLWVNHHLYWNPNDLIAPSASFIVSDGAQPDFSLDGLKLISSITGFSFEQGYVYKLRVKKTKLVHLSNVPIYTYTWLATEQKQIAAGQVFDFEFQKTTRYRRSGNIIRPENVPLEFSCDIPVCDAIDGQVARPEVTSLILTAKVQLPGQPIHFTAVKSVLVQ